MPDRGTVTVEAALALCSLVFVLVLGIGALTAVSAQVRCIDAAREAARLTARGDGPQGEAAARELAPGGARVEVTVTGEQVRVEVAADPLAGLLPGLDVRARATAALEPSAGG